MISAFVKYCSIPLHSLLSGNYQYYRHYKELEKNQWRPVEQLEKERWQTFSSLVRHAYDHTSFYREAIDDLGADPGEIRDEKSFQALPIVTKDTLQRERERLRSEDLDPGPYKEDASGGSTGKPTIFYVDNYRYLMRTWERVRHDRWSGWDLGDYRAIVWGASHDIQKRKNLYPRAREYFLFRRMSLDAFSLTDEKMKTFAGDIVSRKPTVLQVYANAGYAFARYLHDSGFPVAKMGLKGIISSAEKLYDHQRAFIEEVFSCPVFDRLGSREVGLIASECDAHEGLHMNYDNLIVEFLDSDDQPVDAGESGRIVVTDLHNRAMPFIRYDTGDVGAWIEKSCSCGRSFPLIRCVEGRSSDFITARDGRKIHGEYFTHLFYGVRGLKQFQLVQKDLGLVEIEIVKDAEWDDARMTLLMEQIREEMRDPDLTIRCTYVSDIEKPRSGKMRFTISEVEWHD